MKKLSFKKKFVDENELIKALKENENVQSLNLSESSINNLNFLKGLTLTKLEELNISTNKLDDLSGLCHLENLKILYANGLELKTIDFLSNLKKLKELYFEYSNISQLQPIENLEALEKLDLMGNKKVVDLKPLAKLKHLKILYLQGTGINSQEQLDPIRHMQFERISVNETISSHADLLLKVKDAEKRSNFF